LLGAGCGTGRDIGEFIKHGINVEGMDYSKKDLELCRKK
jgi:ubiquinone/menaquinone biosynthesis C-methylase UbiE